MNNEPRSADPDKVLGNIDRVIEEAGDEQVSAGDTAERNREALTGEAIDQLALRDERERGRQGRGQ